MSARAGLAGQVRPLAKRSVRRTLRSPPVVITGLVLPLFLYALNVGGISKAATRLQDFPTDNYAQFALGFTFVFCGIYAVTVAGSQLGEDLQTGFARRLSLSSTRSAAVLIGQLAGVTVYGVIQAIVFLAVGFAAGATVETGPLGVVVIILLSALYALSLGSLGILAAQATGSGEAVQGLFPILMISVFVSSANLPRNLIETDWFQTVATYNPISYLVEAPRSLLVSGWDGEALGLGISVAMAILFAALVNTALTMRTASVRR
jgi:ABC-2 type transport system permease protein